MTSNQNVNTVNTGFVNTGGATRAQSRRQFVPACDFVSGERPVKHYVKENLQIGDRRTDQSKYTNRDLTGRESCLDAIFQGQAGGSNTYRQILAERVGRPVAFEGLSNVCGLQYGDARCAVDDSAQWVNGSFNTQSNAIVPDGVNNYDNSEKLAGMSGGGNNTVPPTVESYNSGNYKTLRSLQKNNTVESYSNYKTLKNLNVGSM